MENRELLMAAKNTYKDKIYAEATFERDDLESMNGIVNGVFIVTVKTERQYEDCIAKFNCYDPAEQFFRDCVKKINAQEVIFPIEHFLWKTSSIEEED